MISRKECEYVFGYVRPMKPELKIREFDTYKAVYCGFCRSLGKRYGFASRLTLSYDYTFLCLLSMGTAPDKVCFSKCRCPAAPWKKKTCAMETGGQYDFCCDVAMLLLYYKLCDNVSDSRGIKKAGWWFVRLFFSRRCKKARENTPELYTIIDKELSCQGDTEKRALPLDAYADPFAKTMSGITELLGHDVNEKRVLHRLGYFVGKYVYLIDAVDDLEDDIKKGGFNPLVAVSGKKDRFTKAETEEIRQNGVCAVNQAIYEISAAYELLNIYRFDSILRNIIFLGLHAAKNNVLTGKLSKTDVSKGERNDN